MKAIPAHIHGGLMIGSSVKVDDNSGAKILHVLSREGYRGRRGRSADVGIGDTFSGAVVQGKADMIKKIVKAVVVRQRKEFRRFNGTRVAFEDNACVLVNEKREPVGTEVKGVVAKEVAERFPKIGTIAKNVI